MRIALPLSISKTQYFVNQAYVHYLEDNSMQPFPVPLNMDVNVVAGQYDGLLLTGGIDIDPIYYGEDNQTSMNTDPVKDDFERRLFHAFREQGKPVFGICRGMQLIAREYMLHMSLETADYLAFMQNVRSHNQVGDQGLDRGNFQHFVNYIERDLYGSRKKKVDRMPVNSMHHQCLVAEKVNKELLFAMGFRIAAWTKRGIAQPKDGPEMIVVEALSIANWGGPILAVQWHPEELQDRDLISNFFLGTVTEDAMESEHI
jgi:putative glutamine amidotransferase